MPRRRPTCACSSCNGILPDEDGQELDAQEVATLVRPGGRGGVRCRGSGEILAERAQRTADAPVPQTTNLAKTTFEQEEAAEEFPGRAVPAIKVQRGDTLARILARLGAQSWQVRAMLEAARPIFAEAALAPGFEVRAIVLPSLARPAGEPVRFSVFDEAGSHKVTVSRNVAGEYVPSATPTEERIAAAALLGESDQVAGQQPLLPACTIPPQSKACRPS